MQNFSIEQFITQYNDVIKLNKFVNDQQNDHQKCDYLKDVRYAPQNRIYYINNSFNNKAYYIRYVILLLKYKNNTSGNEKVNMICRKKAQP